MQYLFYLQRNMLRYVPYFTLELYNFLKQKFKWLKKSHIEFNQVTKQQQQQLAPTKVAPKQVLIYFDIAKHPPPDTQLITKPTPTSPNTTTYVYIILIHSVSSPPLVILEYCGYISIQATPQRFKPIDPPQSNFATKFSKARVKRADPSPFL